MGRFLKIAFFNNLDYKTNYKFRCDTVEQWYGSKYKTEKLDSQKLGN